MLNVRLKQLCKMSRLRAVYLILMLSIFDWRIRFDNFSNHHYIFFLQRILASPLCDIDVSNTSNMDQRSF